MPVVIKYYVIVVALAVSITSLASSLTLKDTVEKIDPSIESVSLCGQWNHGKEQGVYRIIYGWRWGHTEIYVQWLADPVIYPEKGQKARQMPKVIKTASIEEFNQYESATDLDHIECSKQDNRWIIKGNAEDAHATPTKKSRFIIYLFNKPGKYKLVENIPIRD